jgi:peptidoglycan/LPS O-acetylase OafA/YrhL
MPQAESLHHKPELDGIRGLAVIFVVFQHTVFGITPPALMGLSTQMQYGLSMVLLGGVDLFFVLSGFLIGGILLDNKSAENYFPVFWIRRAGRILPVYVLLLVVYLAAIALNSRLNLQWPKDWLLAEPQVPIWSYVTFTQNYIMAIHGDTGPKALGITWSLAVEEQFYFVFPFLVFFLNKRAIVAVAIAGVILAPILRWYLWTVGNFYAGYFPTPARFDSLMLGFLVTCLVRQPNLLPFFAQPRVRIALDVAALALIAEVVEGSLVQWAPTLRFSLLSIVFAYAVLRIYLAPGGLYNALLRNPLLIRAGLISYSWYMYHQTIDGLMHGLFFQHAPQVTNLQQLAVACSVIIVSGTLAVLSTAHFERPFREAARRTATYRFAPRTLQPAQ